MWATASPDALIATWRDALTGFTAEDIRDALAATPAAYTNFPPNLPQFVGLCRDARQRRAQLAVKVGYDAPRQAPDPKVMEALDEFGKPPKDKKQWARDILEEAERGRRFPSISITFAKMALGMQP